MHERIRIPSIALACALSLMMSMPAGAQAQDRSSAEGSVVGGAEGASTQIGGYGELHFNDPEGSPKGELDFHRFVIYLSHSFNDWISFHSETELEHTLVAREEGDGEIALEQAYLELRPWKRYGIRAGILLPPVGILNQYHEPPTFDGVERPAYDKSIIPTTWREAGIGLFGSPADEWSFQAYMVGGLVAKGFSAADGLREGRQEGVRTSTANMAFSVRVDYTPAPGLALGLSGFTGGSTGDADTLGDGRVGLIAADVRWSVGNFSMRAEGAMISIADAAAINAAYGNNVADRIAGWYLEGAYNVLPHLLPKSDQQLEVFARYEHLNTEARVTGFTASGLNDRSIVTTGLSYLPAENVVFKFDYQWFTNAFTNTTSGQLNAGIGYAFF